MHVRPDDAVTPTVAAARRATSATRRLIAATVNSGAPLDELDAAADAIEELADRLEPHRRDTRYAGTPGVRVGGDNTSILETHPLIGPSNPLAPPMTVARDGDRARATVTYSHQYEGPPGRVHGGMLAAAFDLVVGAAAALSGKVFFTGTLTVRYLAPTPLHVPVEFEATLDRVEDRRLFASGRLHVDGKVTAEAEGVFVTVREDAFEGA